MNNYFNYPNFNYQNNKNNPKNMQYMNNYNQNLFTPYEGFIRGNMFTSLYDPYRDMKPFHIKPMNEQADMLTKIDSLGFALTDLNLFLDVNPNDKSAIDLFNQYRKQKEELMKKYQDKYGPLELSSDSLNKYPWMWDNRPWPWEN
ncbi:MAG: spore coat protein CotJB [Firmicutes bacterium]|nr:spore coat protein CotJB [Bacillota bacterium]